MSVVPRGRAAGRRAIGTLAVALAVAGIGPAARASVSPPAGGPLSAPSATASTTPATPAAAATAALRRLHFGVRLVDVPVDEIHNPRALRYIIDFLPTGAVIRRRIMIINDEPRTAHLTVYAAAARITDGMFIGEADHARNELTGWVTVRHPVVTIGPGKSVLDLITIRVPRGATRAEHYGVLWAQQSEIDPEGKHINIRVVARVGIRVYLAVGRGGVPPTKFIIASVAGQETVSGRPEVVVRVCDTGGRAVDLNGQLTLSHGPGGSSAGPFRARQVVTLAPGQSGNVVFVLPKSLPAGPWLATVTLVSGLNRASGHARILFGARLAAASWTSAATLAWGGGMILGVLVIAAAFLARLWRTRRRSIA